MTEKKIKNNMSSSGLTRRSRKKDFMCLLDARSGSGMTSAQGESGRSMVEILGVLAIVGVLSVGSIAGYTYAMNKYYTNELLMGASERAVLVAAQIVAGQEPNLNEFAGHTVPGGTFGVVKTDIEGEFGIAVSGVKDEVCENLLKATDGTDVYIANDDEDLTAVTCSGDNNAFMFVFDYGVGSAGEETDPACANVKCEDGLMCFHGECKCPNGLLMCGEQCCAEGTYCTQGADTSTYTCAEPSGEEGECTQNSDCKDAEGNVDTSKYCKFSGGVCAGPTGGTCTDKGTLTPKTLNLPGGTLTVYKSSGTMNWWSTVNFCEAHDKQLVTMSDLGLANSGTNTVCYFNSSYSSYATEPCICNGGSDSDCSATNAGIRTNTGALGTSGQLWLADNGKLSPCNARRVNLSGGDVNDGRRANGLFALCR